MGRPLRKESWWESKKLLVNLGREWNSQGDYPSPQPSPTRGEGVFRHPPTVSRVPTLICHGEENSDVAISIRL